MDDIATELQDLERVCSDASAEPIKLPYRLLRYVTNNFSNEIGRGGFGVVYMGYLGNGKVAVKKLSNPHVLPAEQFLGEITCLKKSKHKNIVRFLGYCSETHGELLEINGATVMEEAPKMLLCFEYVPSGNIRHYLQQEKSHGDDWPARYQMIRGICHGLHYLHDKQINHLDLKPENVMLDAQMEPKITDFGLSRFLDEGQSTMVTQHVGGTWRYIAPEAIHKGEISFKSDIYALGIIIIELLTGISMISLENWDEYESLDEDCPRVRRCIEIARNCTDVDKHNRPTMHEVISDLDVLDGMIPRSSLNQANPIAFPGTELVDVYPLELRFPFKPNKRMCCQLSLTNKTDGGVYVFIPEIPDRYSYWCQFEGFLPPMSTTAITLAREAEEELPLDTDKLEILILIPGCDEDVFEQQISALSFDEDAPVEDKVKAIEDLLGLELPRATLTAVVVNAEDEIQDVVVDTAGQEEDENIDVQFIDVHPTEPWILIVKKHGKTIYIWNMQTKERIGIYENPAVPQEVLLHYHYTSAKFIPQEQWVVIGDSSGSILVHTCPAMDQVLQFKAHPDEVSSLEVHSTRPLLLSCSNPWLSYRISVEMKLWDWNCGWSCIRVFDIINPVIQVMFNPKHTSTFATTDSECMVTVWRIDHHNPVATMQPLRGHKLGYGNIGIFTYIGDQHFIAVMDNDIAYIWDLRKTKHVYTLHFTEIGLSAVAAVVCHPTHPILVTASEGGSICVWDSTTYRLKKAYRDLPEDPIRICFIGLKRLLIGHKKGISVLDIDLE